MYAKQILFFTLLLLINVSVFGTSKSKHDNTIENINHAYNQLVITCQDQVFKANPSMQDPTGECKAYVNLEATAINESSCVAGRALKWSVLIDRYSDGTFDYEFSSSLPANDNDFSNDTNKNGVPDRYVAPTSSGDVVKVPEFLMGEWAGMHSVLWSVSDACGNIASCSSTFTVSDKKTPIPYCVSLSSVLFQNNQAELWAIDFNKGSFDNCTPQNELLFTFSGEHPVLSKIKTEEHYFKGAGQEATVEEYNAGMAQRWVPSYRSSAKNFNSPGEVEILMSVWDNKMNTDFCIVTVMHGGDPGNSISGMLGTRNAIPINKVNVKVNANVAEFPQFGTFDGKYYFGTRQVADYTIEPTKSDDYTNGISALDIIILKRHLDGTTLLNSPMQLIAADVNRDGKITHDDLKELRQLNAGMIEKFANNDSWIFIPKSYVYPNPTNPYNAPRTITVNVFDNLKNLDFVGIKIGDLDLSAVASQGTTEANPGIKR